MHSCSKKNPIKWNRFYRHEEKQAQGSKNESKQPNPDTQISPNSITTTKNNFMLK